MKDDRDITLPDTEHGVLRAGVEPVEQVMGALEPAVSDGVLSTAEKVVGCQGDGHARGGLVGGILPIATVGALACIECHGDVVEPPRGPTETLESLGGFFLLQR